MKNTKGKKGEGVRKKKPVGKYPSKIPEVLDPYLNAVKIFLFFLSFCPLPQ